MLTIDIEWHDLVLKPSIQKMIAQLSSRVFLGDKLCRNTDWLMIMVNYTVDAVRASEIIRLWPMLLRPNRGSISGILQENQKGA